MTSRAAARRLLLVAGLIVLFLLEGVAQSKQDSPVFKTYRPPATPPLVQASDILYEIWETFLVTREANAGDVLAQHELGIRYLIGRGAAPDTAKAAYWIKKAADQNYGPAQFNMGIIYYYGWGVPWNPFEAYKAFLSCAEKHMAEGEYAMAQFLTEDLVVSRDYEAAYRWLKMAADSGYAPAREAIDRFEKQGYGKSKDSTRTSLKAPNTGLVFLEFAGDSSSARNDTLLLQEAVRGASSAIRKALGMSRMMEAESGTDSTLATVSEAAEAGSPEALTLLGRSFDKGTGKNRDVVKAVALYVRALRLDSPRAPELLWNLLQEKETLPRIKAAAGKGDAEAQFGWAGVSALGFDGVLAQAQMYVTGEEAFQLLRKAAEQEYLPALVEEGLCYYAGRWVPQSAEKALGEWEKGAALGSTDAKIRIALTALRSTTEDTVRRAQDIAFLVESAERGSVLAEVGLGYCYETGLGVPTDKAKAAHYYRISSVRGSQDAFRALRRMHDAIRPGDAAYIIRE
jgi:hypothetical protein